MEDYQIAVAGCGIAAFGHGFCAGQTISVRKEVLIALASSILVPICWSIPSLFPHNANGRIEGEWFLAAALLALGAVVSGIVSAAMWIHILGRGTRHLVAKLGDNKTSS